MWGLNLSYNKEFMWLTNLFNKVTTINAVSPSRLSLNAEFAQLVPHKQKTGTAKGSSYIDDFESTQIGIDLRNPYSWFLASTPYERRTLCSRKPSSLMMWHMERIAHCLPGTISTGCGLRKTLQCSPLSAQ